MAQSTTQQYTQMEINNLFPTPVARFKLGRDLTENEYTFLSMQENRPNQSNVTSVNKTILKNKECQDLKQFIEDSLKEYFDAVYSPKDDLSIYITQSWTNYTKQDEFHHKHNHGNSIVSGVFYIKAIKDTDKIHFFRENLNQIRISPKDWNVYNSESWWLGAETGDLLLFPSTLTHMVEKVTHSEGRISLSFNTFLRGNLGDEMSLTGLTLE